MSVSMLLLSGAMTAAASFRVFTPGEHPDKKKARQAAFNHRVEDSFTDRHIAGLLSHKVYISLYSGQLLYVDTVQCIAVAISALPEFPALVVHAESKVT